MLSFVMPIAAFIYAVYEIVQSHIFKSFRRHVLSYSQKSSSNLVEKEANINQKSIPLEEKEAYLNEESIPLVELKIESKN